MKAVILSALPGARLLDITHAIPPQSIRHAEVVLRGSAFAMPIGTVHLVVVDPGVGTDRRPIAVRARGLTFVGPDNGVLGVALADPHAQTVVLDRLELFRRPVAPTFHGRDIFAPVAAELAAGLALTDVGTPIDDALPSRLPRATRRDACIEGEVLVADHFGNLLTNISGQWLDRQWSVHIDDRPLRWVQAYGQGVAGELLVLCGSDGFLEIASRDASAAHQLGRHGGMRITCTRER
jgi:S-adenosylmethionine hydrolase